MKKKTTILFIAVILIVITFAVIFLILASQADKPLKDALSFYNKSIETIDLQKVEYQISSNTTTLLGDETYFEETCKTVNLNHTENSLIAHTKESTQINGEDITIEEWYENKTAYCILNGSYFSTDMDADAFTDRFLPLLILDPQLYGSISGIKHRNGYTINFKNPKALESWLNSSTESMEAAEGVAEFTKDGVLFSLTYSVSYYDSNKQIKASVTTNYLSSTPNIPTLEKNKYSNTTALDAAILLERSCCLILGAKTAESKYKEHTFCEAFGDEQTKEIHVATDSQNDWTSTVKTVSNLTSIGKAGIDNTITKEEQFSDGIYTISLNGSPAKADDSVTKEDVQTVCQDIMISTVILPEHIDSFTISKSSNITTYTFKVNKALSEQFKESALAKLYNDPTVLNTETDDYRINISTCYLSVDSTTGLPISSGFHYEGAYTINGLQYLLIFTSDQEYTLID